MTTVRPRRRKSTRAATDMPASSFPGGRRDDYLAWRLAARAITSLPMLGSSTARIFPPACRRRRLTSASVGLSRVAVPPRNAGVPGGQQLRRDSGTRLRRLSMSNFNSPISSLTVTLPSNTAIQAGWTRVVDFCTDSGKTLTVAVNGTSGGQILMPGTLGAESSLTLYGQNYEFVRLDFDGSNFRVVSVTPATASANGMFPATGTPATSSTACQTGQIQFDSNFLAPGALLRTRGSGRLGAASDASSRRKAHVPDAGLHLGAGNNRLEAQFARARSNLIWGYSRPAIRSPRSRRNGSGPGISRSGSMRSTRRGPTRRCRSGNSGRWPTGNGHHPTGDRDTARTRSRS